MFFFFFSLHGYSGRDGAVVVFTARPPGTDHGVGRVRGQRVERARLPVPRGTVPDARAERYVGQAVRDRQRLVFRPVRAVDVRVRHPGRVPANRRARGPGRLACTACRRCAWPPSRGRRTTTPGGRSVRLSRFRVVFSPVPFYIVSIPFYIDCYIVRTVRRAVIIKRILLCHCKRRTESNIIENRICQTKP